MTIYKLLEEDARHARRGGVQSIKKKSPRVISNLGNINLSTALVKKSFSIRGDVAELGLRAIGFDLVLGHQWLRPSLESRQPGL